MQDFERSGNNFGLFTGEQGANLGRSEPVWYNSNKVFEQEHERGCSEQAEDETNLVQI